MPRSAKRMALAALAFLGCGGSSTQLGGATAIAAGYSHTCAIVGGGALCWGDDSEGQVGDELTSTATTSPVQVFDLTSGVSAIAGGGQHTCAIVGGSLECWGSNYYGQLGNNSTSTVANVPLPVLGLPAGGVSMVSAGYSHTCAVAGGAVYCWGSNASGQLGSGTAGGTSLLPVQVPSLTVGVTAIAAGYAHTCALQNGGVQCWGSNAKGELGDGTDTDSDLPVPASGLSSGVLGVASGPGSQHTCALLSGGTVYCWGLNDFGQIGAPSTTMSPVPVQVPSLTAGVSALALGGTHSCAVVNGGALCWGNNDFGQIGTPSTTASPVPLPVGGLTSGVSSIAAGGTHTCAVAGGAVQCFGQDQFGQLGNGALSDSGVPVFVQ